MNPLAPTGYDIAMTLLVIASAALTISTIILIVRSSSSRAGKIVAGLAVVAFPVIGPVAYLVFRRRL